LLSLSSLFAKLEQQPHDTVSLLEMALSRGNCFRILHQVSSAYEREKKSTEK
jgi:hypothetical protein